MRKLFTPFNIGAFHLRHRIVVEWPQPVEPLDATTNLLVPPSDSHLSGGLVICDPGPLIWPGPARLAPSESGRIGSAWRNVIEKTKSSDESVLARLRADLSFQIPDQRSGVRALTHDDIGYLIGGYVDAANRAKSSGFDGIELDGSFGSVTDLFLRSSTNLRSDRYGGPVVQRSNFVMELVEALTLAFGRERVGVRLTPFEMSAQDNVYDEVLRCLCDQEIAYIHLELTEQFAAQDIRLSPSAKALREAYPGILIASCQQGLDFAVELVESRWADAVSFSASRIDAQFLHQLRQEGFDGTGG